MTTEGHVDDGAGGDLFVEEETKRREEAEKREGMKEEKIGKEEVTSVLK